MQTKKEIISVTQTRLLSSYGQIKLKTEIMRTFLTALLLCMSLGCLGQSIQLKGIIKNEDKQAIEFANIVLQTRDSSMVSGASSDAKGHFEL